MEKRMTLKELGDTQGWEEAVIVFTADSFGEEYSEQERSYKVSSNSKWFKPHMNGMSLFGDCLDGKDLNVRLDVYMRLAPEEGKRWSVEYCYIIK